MLNAVSIESLLFPSFEVTPTFAAAIARMVRELRNVAFPEEQHAIKSAAAWAVAGDFLRCRDFDSADVVVLDGWWALPPLARQLLGRAVSNATRSGSTERASLAAAKAAASCSFDRIMTSTGESLSRKERQD